MDLVTPQDRLCYVSCAYCNTMLAVGVPCKKMMDTVTVKCGHCNSLSYLNPKPPSLQPPVCPNHHQLGLHQGPCTDCIRKSHQFLPSSSASSSSEETSPKAPYVVKPPEKKHRLPSAYNRFMREEIQRIKAANPEMPHREAFSNASKNWARCEYPRTLTASTADRNDATAVELENTSGLLLQSFDVFKH